MICIYVSIYIAIYLSSYLSFLMHVCMYVCMYVRMYACVWVCMHSCVPVCVRVRVSVRVCVCVYVHACTWRLTLHASYIHFSWFASAMPQVYLPVGSENSLCFIKHAGGARLSDATVPNEAVHQRGKPSLISLVYLQRKASPKYPKSTLFSSWPQ